MVTGIGGGAWWGGAAARVMLLADMCLSAFCCARYQDNHGSTRRQSSCPEAGVQGLQERTWWALTSDLWPLDVSWWFRLWQQFSAAGVKIIGGCKEQSGEQFGIYVKRVVSGGLAALDGRNRDFMNYLAISRKKKEITVLINDCHWRDVCVPGRLKAGDLILDVNNISLVGVTNERWVCCIGLSGCLRSYLQMSPLLIPFHQAVMSLISCPLIGQWRSWGWPPSPITCPYWLREMKNPGEEKKPAWVVSFHADQQFVIAKCSVDSTCALAALPQQGLKLVSRKLLFSKWNHQRS